jgi:hypothetical protein
MKIIKIYEPSPFHNTRALNMRQLLNPIFFSVDCRHPDQKRQRSSRRRTRALRNARNLKAQQFTWVPDLPTTDAWETWFAARGWTRMASVLGRTFDEY